MSHDTCRMSRVTCHVSRFTCHVSNVTCHIFFIKGWSLLVDGLLSTGPNPSSLFLWTLWSMDAVPSFPFIEIYGFFSSFFLLSFFGIFLFQHYLVSLNIFKIIVDKGYIGEHYHLHSNLHIFWDISNFYPLIEITSNLTPPSLMAVMLTVSVLWQEEGYTVNYNLSTMEIPRAEPKGFPEGSGCISPTIPTDILNF